MLTVHLIHAGSGDPHYYTKGFEYYLLSNVHSDGGEEKQTRVMGVFFGQGATALGLTSMPILEADSRFSTLFQGYNPVTGTPLRRGLGTERSYVNSETGEEKISKSVVALDLTVSLGKDVSILGMLGPANVRKKIYQAAAQAAGETIQNIERQVGYVRRGAGGKGGREKAGLVVALFPHQLNRNEEPNLHFHMVVINAGIHADGRSGALDSKRLLNKQFIHGHGQEFRESFYSHLSRELQEYGLRYRRTEFDSDNGWTYRIDGIPQNLCDALSTRSKEVAQKLKEMYPETKNPTSYQVQAAVLESRKKKSKNVRMSELKKHWRTIAEEHGFDAVKFLEESRQRAVSFHKEPEAKQATTPKKRASTPQRMTKRSVSEPASVAPDYQRLQQLKHQARAIKQHVHSHQQPAQRTPKNIHASRPVNLVRQFRALVTRRQSLDERIQKARAKAQKRRKRVVRKLLFLYATGQISRRTYLKYTRARQQPQTNLGIEFQYWTGRMKLGQRLALHRKQGHATPKKGVPRSRLGVEIAYARGQISEVQKLLLLKKRQEEKQSKRKQSQRTRKRTHRL